MTKDTIFIPSPDHAEYEKQLEWCRKFYGDCAECKRHHRILAVCGVTKMPLTYPIKGCPKKKI